MSKNSGEEAVLTCIMYSILFTNDLLNSNIFDMLCELKSSGFYKEKVKFRVKNLERAIKHYNGFINKTRHAGFIADMNDLFLEKVSHDMLVASHTIINYFKREKVPYPDLMGMMAVCDVLCVEACRTVDDNIKVHSTKYPYVTRFSKLRVDKIAAALICLSHALEDEMWKIRHYNVDLRKQDDIQMAFKIIREKLNDPNVIMDILEAYDIKKE